MLRYVELGDDNQWLLVMWLVSDTSVILGIASLHTIGHGLFLRQFFSDFHVRLNQGSKRIDIRDDGYEVTDLFKVNFEKQCDEFGWSKGGIFIGKINPPLAICILFKRVKTRR